jgi:UDP-N-acetylglucosamine 2-epimerase
MKVFTVVGARPQFIKAAPVSKAIRAQHSEFLVHTGQHYDEAMSEVFFRDLAIPAPDANLGVGSGAHGAQTGAMLAGLEALMQTEQPDWVLLYGDTNSTLAGALAAAKLNLKVAHVEAGLRSYNRTMPEEINRVLTDHVSHLLFCPTQSAIQNLGKEGITQGVHLVGDVMVDALLSAQARAADSPILADLGLAPNQFYLATIHRPANTDSRENLMGILAGLATLQTPIVLPAHPRLTHILEREGLSIPANVRVIPPANYLEMIALLQAAQVIITDSGGLQKEAYILARPCVTVRPETEWVETVQAGWNRLCDPTPSAIEAALQAALSHSPAQHPDFYGAGQASQQIVGLMADYKL